MAIIQRAAMGEMPEDILRAIGKNGLNASSETLLMTAAKGGIIKPGLWKGSITANDISQLTPSQLKEMDKLLQAGKILDDAEIQRVGDTTVPNPIKPPEKPPVTKGTGKLPNRIFDEYGNPLPYGFSNVKQYNDFVKVMKADLPAGTQILFQGSSVSGKSYKSGKVFDEGRVSDFDIALVNDDLFLEALEIGRKGGFKMKTDSNRIGPLDKDQLAELGLKKLIDKLSKEAGRPVSFMLCESVEQALKRPSLMVTP
ncbi:hypothetical protein PAECIP111893_01309 [Paenibacillus plantiphilus]|uniref:Uncharacterized protein n=1 Tax=Paenibacillus plantiphilus TaxID=2905650 RepID=A0ABN8GCE6_9BACL|nr:hypothetical protein [Paenibacillus plantiphilus]CAH1199315.1 hypothetical protein PAECIP111893_01309 [Paenibacillus plantiphilus]